MQLLSPLFPLVFILISGVAGDAGLLQKAAYCRFSHVKLNSRWEFVYSFFNEDHGALLK